ncbi:hypothetical protein [Paracoccus sp. R86501]|uniref:hypothetical protein n=1 Tax=Paracoccus sp. R86501 TaxID=3101711 RepID=UPI00366BE426
MFDHTGRCYVGIFMSVVSINRTYLHWTKDHFILTATYLIARFKEKMCKVGRGLFSFGQPRSGILKFSDETENSAISAGSPHVRADDNEGAFLIKYKKNTRIKKLITSANSMHSRNPPLNLIILKYLVASILITPSLSDKAHSGPFDAAVGIITDPFKLGSLGSDALAAVERFALMAETLEKNVNAHAKERIADISNILSELHLNSLNIIEKGGIEATNVIDFAVSEVEQATKNMLDDFMHTALCTSETVSANVEENLANSLNRIGAPKVKIFGITVFKGEWNPGDITDPQKSFLALHNEIKIKLESLKPNDPASIITQAYDEIRRQATITMCHYNSSYIAFEHLFEIELEYRRRQVFWMNRVNPL